MAQGRSEHTAPQDLERDLEDEGVPDLEGPLDEKAMTGDSQEGVAPPRERPGAVRDWGVTAAEQRSDEPLRRRLLRESPEAGDAAAEEAPEPAGRLAEPESDIDTENRTAEEVASDVGEDNRGFSAEEAAMHPTDL
jgi:hypothetical protein